MSKRDPFPSVKLENDFSFSGYKPQLEEWLQQIPGTTSEISVQKSTLLGTAKILCRTLRLPGPSGRGPESEDEKKIHDKLTHLAQAEEPWSHLHDRATISSSRRNVRHHDYQAPKDSLDFNLKTVYDQHKDCFRSKNQVLYQRETVPEDHRNLEKQDPVVSEWEENIRVWVDPQRRSIYSIK